MGGLEESKYTGGARNGMFGLYQQRDNFDECTSPFSTLQHVDLLSTHVAPCFSTSQFFQAKDLHLDDGNLVFSASLLWLHS
jgi:hypothetical protein